MQSGDWQAARESYRAAAETDRSGEALFGLGVAQWWLGEAEASLRSWEQAYVEFRRESDHAQAVVAAFYLCLGYRMSLGNDVAANGWLERASSLVDEFDVVPLAGWVLLARAYSANDSGDPSGAAELAGHAVEAARDTGDPDLRLCATAELGAALLASGHVDDGAPLLDQAMAAALAGEGNDLDTVVLVSCRTITACSRSADVRRAMQWIRAADDFHRRYGSTHLYTTCRAHHGAVLFAAGDWQRADDELQLALRTGSAADAALRAEASAKLAELRLAQGRIQDAERLLAGLEDHPSTTVARARLHLVAGQPTVAASLLRRRLRDLDDRHIEGAILVDALAEAGIHDTVPAGFTAAEEDDTGVGAAYRRRAAGRTGAPGDVAALHDLEAALSIFGALQMPYECARTRMLLAQAVADDDRDAAITEAQIALGAFEQLGAARDADAAVAFLRTLGARAVRTSPRTLDTLTKREAEILGLLGEGLSNPAIAERLFISRRTVEHHVANVLDKLGLTGRTEAAAYAARLSNPSGK